MHTPPWLKPSALYHQSVMPFLRGEPPPKKNPGSTRLVIAVIQCNIAAEKPFSGSVINTYVMLCYFMLIFFMTLVPCKTRFVELEMLQCF